MRTDGNCARATAPLDRKKMSQKALFLTSLDISRPSVCHEAQMSSRMEKSIPTN